MTTVTDDDLDLLLDLSDADAELARVAAQLDDLPEQRAVDDAVGRRDQVTREGDALRVEVTTAEAEQRRLERDVDQYRARLDAERARLYGGEITNAREMQSVEAEIAATEARIDEREEAMLASMEAVEDLESRIEDRARTAEQTSAEITRLEAVRDEAAQALLARRAELSVHRDDLRERLGDEALAAYDRARERFPAGAAVGELTSRACSACRIELPHAEVNELRDGPPLATCPSCRRLLVVR